MGCCMGYPSLVKQQELKWAEKGPRGSGENRYSRSGMVSTPRSPAPRTPNRGRNNHHAGSNNNNPASFVGNAQSSFVMGSPYSPYYSPTNHPLPFQTPPYQLVSRQNSTSFSLHPPLLFALLCPCANSINYHLYYCFVL